MGITAFLLAGVTVAALAWRVRRDAPELWRIFFPPSRQLQDEVIVIVGASSGVGAALRTTYMARAREAPSNAKISLHLVARSDLAQHACSEKPIRFCAGTFKTTTSQMDATSYKNVCELAAELRATFGRVDTLILCVGALTVQPVMKLAYSAKDPRSPGLGIDLGDTSVLTEVATASYRANVLSAMNVISSLVPLLQKSTKPRVAVISSVAAEIPAPTRAIYAANKAALSVFLKCLRIELQDVPNAGPPKEDGRSAKGIGITIVYPASIKTGLRETALDARYSTGTAQPHEEKAMSSGQVAEAVANALEYEVDELWLPAYYWGVAKLGMLLAPKFIARKAKQKYKW